MDQTYSPTVNRHAAEVDDAAWRVAPCGIAKRLCRGDDGPWVSGYAVDDQVRPGQGRTDLGCLGRIAVAQLTMRNGRLFTGSCDDDWPIRRFRCEQIHQPRV